MELVVEHTKWSLRPHNKPLPEDKIRVQVVLAGLCRTDIQNMEGLRPLHNRVIGHEACGIICHIPQSLQDKACDKGFRLGQEVAIFPFLACNDCQAKGIMERCPHRLSLGTDYDGAFSPFVDVDISQVFLPPTSLSSKHLAFAEPVCASLAVCDINECLDPSLTVCVAGQGRIASLTALLLNTVRQELNPSSIDVVIVSPQDLPKDCFDVVVETQATEQSMFMCCQALKSGGLLVVKSRPAWSVPYPHTDIVMRDLRLKGASYTSFAKTLRFMARHKDMFTPFFGTVFDWNEESIRQAVSLEKKGEESGKIFFQIGSTHTKQYFHQKQE